ncbi:hypothetical protein PtB15_1B966 [Puccinia triticina]|nr:hypothetical protein PtB15_1B966 [Puccinia triticina]
MYNLSYLTNNCSAFPSLPVNPHPPSNAEAPRHRLRSSARPPPPVPIAGPEPAHPTPALFFLIKRRGSLPVSENTPAETQEDYQHPLFADEDNKKRKVRFKRDIFCLEFDQLPLSRQPKRAKVLQEDHGPDPRPDPATKRKGQRRNTVSEELWDPEEPSGRVGERQMYPAFATVNLSGLLLSNTPPPNPADAAHLPSGTAVDPCSIIPASPLLLTPVSFPGPPPASLLTELPH